MSGNENAAFRIRKWLTQSEGGAYFGDVLLPHSARLRRIYVHSANLVDGLQFEYALPDGRAGLSRFAGGVGGWRHGFELPEGEVLRAVSGSFGRFVNSIRFHTASMDSYEYGMPAGERFFLEFGDELKFRGIFGREGLYVDSLGIVLEQALPVAPAAVLPMHWPRPVQRLPLGKDGPVLAGLSRVDRKAA